LLPYWALAAIGTSLALTTTGLYLVVWQGAATWQWLSTIALGYLVTVGLTAFYLGLSRGMAAALICAATMTPLLWPGWQLYRSPGVLIRLGVVALTFFVWAYLLGTLVEHKRVASEQQIQESRQLRARIDELAAMQRISNAFHFKKPIPEILQLAAQAISQGMGFKTVLISLAEDDPPVLRRMAAIGLPDPVLEELQQVRQPLSLVQNVMQEEFRISQSYYIPRQVQMAKQDALPAGIFPKAGQNGGQDSEDLLIVPMYGMGHRIIGIITVNQPLDGRVPDRSVVETLQVFVQQTATTVENCRLYEDLQRRAESLLLINQVGQMITSGLDLESVLKGHVSASAQLLNCNYAVLFDWSQESKQLVPQVAHGFSLEDQELFSKAELDQLTWIVIDRGNSIIVSDIDGDPRFSRLSRRPLDLKSMLVVPLVEGLRVGGALAAGATRSNAFNQTDRVLLSTLADQASVAIQNARLYESTVRRATQLEMLNDIGKTIISSLDMDTTLSLILEKTGEVLNAEAGSLLLMEKDHLRFRIAFGPSAELVKTFTLEKGQGIAGWVAQTGESVLVSDVKSDWRHSTNVDQATAYETRSLLCVPLKGPENRIVGVLNMLNPRDESTFTKHDQELLESIANFAVIAIENANLFDQVTRITENLEYLVAERTEALAQANRDLRAERDRLDALYQITRELSSSLEPDRVLNRTLALLNRVLGAEQGYILLRDPESGNLVYRAMLGTSPLPREKMASTSHSRQIVASPQGQNLLDWLVEQRETIRIDDLASDTRLQLEDQDGLYRSVLATQLPSGNDIAGMVLFYHSTPGYFTDDHQRMLDAIASPIGIMTSNAELLHLLREATSRLGKMLLAQQLDAAKSQAILEGVADGVMVMDARGQITLFNAAAERILRVSRDNVIGQMATTMSGLDNLTETSWADLAEQWSSQDLEASEEALHEERFEVEDRVVSIRVAPVIRQGMFEGTVSVFRDITKDVEVDRLKSDFVSMVSHELRTPMTSLKGYIDLLHSEMAGPVNDAQKRFLQILKDNADRLTVLLNDLLDISRIDTGRIRLSMEAIDLLGMINDVIVNQTPAAKKKGHTLTNLIQGSLPLVRADPNRATQILTNLTANAIHYTPTGGRVTVDAQVAEDFVFVHVADNGIGISEEEQTKLFNRFFRSDHPLVQASSGTGLGLSIVKALVELQGGQVWFESRLGEGSTFSFSLPLANREAKVMPERKFKTISYRAQDKHILVIEDEPDIANLISHQIRQKGGYRVHIVHSGQDAIDYLATKDCRVDLVTLDLRLPDMNGLQVLRKIRANPSAAGIPVIIVSILPREREGQRLGAQAYIPKPIEDGKLIATIEQILTAEDKVLIVEDDRQLADMLRQALEQNQFTVITEYDGRQGVHAAQEENPGMILLDLKLPGMDGFEVLSKLKAIPETHDIPVIVITGSITNEESKRKRVLDMGAVQFLTKPLSIKELVVEIQKLAGRNAKSPD
jgi:PAS domain S-box-containing protein